LLTAGQRGDVLRRRLELLPNREERGGRILVKPRDRPVRFVSPAMAVDVEKVVEAIEKRRAGERAAPVRERAVVREQVVPCRRLVPIDAGALVESPRPLATNAALALSM